MPSESKVKNYNSGNSFITRQQSECSKKKKKKVPYLSIWKKRRHLVPNAHELTICKAGVKPASPSVAGWPELKHTMERCEACLPICNNLESL